MKETTIISGFPGVGKTEFFKDQKYHGGVCLDSDSSEFSWVIQKKETQSFQIII